MSNIYKRYRKTDTKKEYDKNVKERMKTEDKTFPIEKLYKKLKQYFLLKDVDKQWVNLFPYVIALLFFYIGWNRGDGFFSRSFYLAILGVFYFFILIPFFNFIKEMINISKIHPKIYTTEEYNYEYNRHIEELMKADEKFIPINHTDEMLKKDLPIKVYDKKWVKMLSFVVALLLFYIAWNNGDGFFSTLFFVVVLGVVYFFILMLFDIFFEKMYIDERKMDKSYFKRDVVLLDTNIFMGDEKYDAFFLYLLKNKIKITVLGSVFDEMRRLKRNKQNYDTYIAASIGLGRLSRLQDNGLAIIKNIDIQLKNKIYADSDIINYAKNHNNKSILIISNHLDLKIRADKFINSDKSNAALGKDIIRLI